MASGGQRVVSGRGRNTPTMPEAVYRRAVTAAAMAAIVREADGVALDAALAIIQRGRADLVALLEGLPEDSALVDGAAAWLEGVAYRLLKAGDCAGDTEAESSRPGGRPPTPALPRRHPSDVAL